MTQNRLGGMCPPDFKPPDQAVHNVTSAPQPKKRRKTSNANAAAAAAAAQQPQATPQDLLPPPLSGYGDTIIASNPFDDAPSAPMMLPGGPPGGVSGPGGNIGPPHPGVGNVPGGPGGPNGPMMNPMMHGMPPPHAMHPNHAMGGPSMRGMHPMNPMNPMMNHPMNAGGMNSRHGPGGPQGHMNPNMGPGGPMAMPPGPGMNSNMGNMNMSSMVGGMGPMPPHMAGAGGVPNPNVHMGMNSPNMTANGNRLGSPMGSSGTGSALGSPIGNNPHMGNSPMGPPMHSPLGNGPMHMPPTQPPGSRINVSNGSPLNVNAPPTSQGNVSPMMGNVPGSCNGPNLSHHPQHNEQLHNAMGAPPAIPHMPQQSPLGNSGPGSGPDNTNLISNNVDLMGMNHQQNHHMNPMNAINGPGGMHPPNHQMNRMYGVPGGPGPKPMSMGAGKVYPPNQPMVFNPQNPSAPPIYTCGCCHKEINDNDEEALFCESGCNFFFHR